VNPRYSGDLSERRGRAANAQRARALGAVAYWTKPFDPLALAAFVANELVPARAGPSELTAAAAA
jgi:CheY-like chemotaxis protein